MQSVSSSPELTAASDDREAEARQPPKPVKRDTYPEAYRDAYRDAYGGDEDEDE